MMNNAAQTFSDGHGNTFEGDHQEFKERIEDGKQEFEIQLKPKKKRKNKRKKKSNINPQETKGNNIVGGSDLLAMAGNKDCDAVQNDVLTGEDFGKGWWMSSSAEGKDQVKSTGVAAAVGLKEADYQTRLKFKDFYSDSEDDTQDEMSTVKKVQTRETSATGASFEAAFSKLQINKNADKKPEKETEESSSDRRPKWGVCSYCGKEGHPLQCSRCQISKYCNRQCQKNDYKHHKLICRRKVTFDTFQSKIPEVLKLSFALKSGNFSVSHTLDDLPSEFEYACGIRSLVMAEITGPYFHIFRYGICIRDMAGHETFILFYINSDCYWHITSDAVVQRYPLSECLRPGNFILLLDTRWHGFVDGTYGIRINHLDEVHFIFKN